jgi:hypothetical protein
MALLTAGELILEGPGTGACNSRAMGSSPAPGEREVSPVLRSALEPSGNRWTMGDYSAMVPGEFWKSLLELGTLCLQY